jgi:energy-coupling factor transporter ATP-binding protein EcfA2
LYELPERFRRVSWREISIVDGSSERLLDEPYAGFDLDTYVRFLEWLRETRERGRAIVVVSHLVREHGLFERTLLLSNGKLSESMPKALYRVGLLTGLLVRDLLRRRMTVFLLASSRSGLPPNTVRAPRSFYEKLSAVQYRWRARLGFVDLGAGARCALESR